MGTEKRERQRANRQLKYQQLAKEEQRRKLTRRVVIGALAVVGGVALVIGIAWLGGAGDDDDEPSASSLPAVTTPATATGSSVPGSTPASTAPGSTVAPAGFTYGTGACPPEDVAEPVRTFAAAPAAVHRPGRDLHRHVPHERGRHRRRPQHRGGPGTVNNFVTLARYGYYDDTLIFRTASSVAGEIIQGGGQTNADSPGYTIPDEGAASPTRRGRS